MAKTRAHTSVVFGGKYSREMKVATSGNAAILSVIFSDMVVAVAIAAIVGQDLQRSRHASQSS
jgi:hypothetical protein